LDLVGDAGGELAEGSQLLGLDQAALRGAQVIEGLRELAGARLDLLEQAHVLDRDDGLVGERCHQFDLALAEWTGLLLADTEHALDASVTDQRDAESGPESASFGIVTISVFGIGEHVGNMHQLAGYEGSSDEASAIATEGMSLHKLMEAIRHPEVGFRAHD